MSDRRFAIIDPAAGISGDMLLGALIDSGAPVEWLQELPGRLGCPEVSVDVASVFRCGVRATKVGVRLPGGRQEHPAETVHERAPAVTQAHTHGHEHEHRHASERSPAHSPPHDHAHEHDHGPHRHIGELIAMLRGADLSSSVRERAIQAFRLLGEAEGRVHGVPADDVALHEVGALDAVIDIVGGIEGFERLNIERVYHRPVALGSGWIRAAHGILPVPAPATAMLLEGFDVAPNGPVEGEATTPTGAVLLRVLSSGPPPGAWRLVGQGWGAGGRDPAHYPNALRLLLANTALEAGQVVVLTTDIDDMSPEYVVPLQEAAFAAGALDVQLWTTQAKKGRTGFRLEVTTSVANADRVGQALFRHSTTGGLRRQLVERVTLPRREIAVAAADGTMVRVKVLDGPDGIRVKPEFEDVLAVARRTGQAAHDIANDLHDRAVRLLHSEG